MLPKPGDVVGGKYRILRLLGEGGMGAVFEARHEILGANVAIKFLHPEFAQTSELIARFMQEARVAATVFSPHIARVTDVDRLPNGSAYLVMELLLGESLQQRLDRTAILPREEAVDIILQILTGLESAHERGVIHRDLKPDNVFITMGATGMLVKLVDFGVAKLKQNGPPEETLTRPGEVMGTPEYMAPEQALASDQIDARADIYSVGVMLYEMLTGRRPIEADDPGEIIEKVVMGQSVPVLQRDPKLAPALAAIIDDATAPDASRRPASARELRSRLAPFGSVASPAPDSALPPPAVLATVVRPSSVPDTLPPHDSGPPPSVLGTDLRPLGVRNGRSGRPPRTRSMSWRRHYLVAALVAGALCIGVGAYLFIKSSFLSSSEPPPLPAIPIPEATPVPPRLREQANDSYSERRAARRPSTRAPTRTPQESETETPASPSFPIPPFSIPSALPPVPGLPTMPSMPQLPQIPGLPPFATTPTTASSAGAAPPGSATP